jgi:Uma2 family endonuclease
MNVAHKYLPHYTYEDYLHWEGRWELIDGIPYAMAPMPVPEHQLLAGNLHAEFRASLKKAGCGCKVYQPLDYKLSDDTIFNPDLLIICKPITKKFLDFPPDLVVEILSESIQMKDRNVKFPKYEAEGIPYYLMIDPDSHSVEVYQLINGRYHRQPLDQNKPYPIVFGDCRLEIVFDAIWSKILTGFFYRD